MVMFGGYTVFGGDAMFGGEESRLAQYYRALKSMDPPGVFRDDDESIHYHLMLVDALGAAHSQRVIDHLELELFPHTAEATLPEWETSYRLSPKPSARVSQRRDACVSRWRATSSSSPKHIRQALASVLNPTTAFRDTCDDSSVSWRYEQSGNGTRAETASYLTMTIAGSTQCDWDAAEQNASRCMLDIVDRSDDIYISAKIDRLLSTGASGTWGGVCLCNSTTNAVGFQIEKDGGSNYLVPWRISDGVKYTGSYTALGWTLSSTNPLWLQIAKVSSTYYFYYGQSLSALTLLTSFSTSLMSRAIKQAGIFAGNDSADSYPDVEVDFDQVELKYGEQYNNVELIETTLALAAAGEDEDIFFAFVHRDPSDDGSYDISEAQSTANRMKQAHTLILVGESDVFRCDDPYSLTDRDVLGS